MTRNSHSFPFILSNLLQVSFLGSGRDGDGLCLLASTTNLPFPDTTFEFAWTITLTSGDRSGRSVSVHRR